MLVNIWSYKVRAMLCNFSFSGIKVLGYWEKRQSRLDIINNEINNVSWLCETISQAIKKAELEAGQEVDEIVINPFFSNIFYYSKTISYKQRDNTVELWNKDIFKIVNNAENISIRSITSEISDKYWFDKQDLNLILSNISSLSIDWKKIQNLYWEVWEDIKIKILNSFISKANYENIYNVANYLDKKILNIIPEEYAITKLWNIWEAEVFVDIGNSSTGLSIKLSDDSLKWAIRLEIWIDDLVKEISKKDSRSRWEIIKKINRDDLFKEEKQGFLSFFSDILIEWLKEILKWDICPNNFILIWWWANNFFMKEYFTNKDFNSLGVKMVNKINFTSASIDQIRKIIGVEKVLNISNINIIASAITCKNILNSENDIMEKALEESVRKSF
jgi:hypothetical protein